jgi:hypothetical protein
VPLEEPRYIVDGLVGLVQRSELKLEDMRTLGRHLQPHLDLVPASGADRSPAGTYRPAYQPMAS